MGLAVYYFFGAAMAFASSTRIGMDAARIHKIFLCMVLCRDQLAGDSTTEKNIRFMPL